MGPRVATTISRTLARWGRGLTAALATSVLDQSSPGNPNHVVTQGPRKDCFLTVILFLGSLPPSWPLERGDDQFTLSLGQQGMVRMSFSPLRKPVVLLPQDREDETAAQGHVARKGSGRLGAQIAECRQGAFPTMSFLPPCSPHSTQDGPGGGREARLT